MTATLRPRAERNCVRQLRNLITPAKLDAIDVRRKKPGHRVVLLQLAVLHSRLQEMLGYLLRDVRENTGLPQEQSAFQAGVDRTYVSQLEHDKKPSTVQMLFRLCQAMGTSPAKIIVNLEKQLAKSKASSQR